MFSFSKRRLESESSSALPGKPGQQVAFCLLIRDTLKGGRRVWHWAGLHSKGTRWPVQGAGRSRLCPQHRDCLLGQVSLQHATAGAVGGQPAGCATDHPVPCTCPTTRCSPASSGALIAPDFSPTGSAPIDPSAVEGRQSVTHPMHPPARLRHAGTSVHVADMSTGGGLALFTGFDENARGRQCPAVRAST